MKKTIVAIMAAFLLTGCQTTTVSNPYVYMERAIDGDTIELTNGDKVRMLGIDTPERGQCGYKEATLLLEELIDDMPVVLVKGGKTDKDRYGRLVRYVEVKRRDVGLEMIQAGRAIARYDSRDGYGLHKREPAYIEADANSKSTNVC